MRTLVLSAALIAALVPARAGAQTLPLTESQLLAQLAPESPQVQAARAGVDVARAEGLTAGRWPNPRVTFNREAVAGITEDMVMVSQVLPITGRRRLDVSAAAARVDAASGRADARLRRLRADVRLAFTDLWAAQIRERELARSRDRFQELADVLGRREAAGEAAGFDALRADREVISLDADRATAAMDRARAQAILASYVATSTSGAAIEAIRTNAAPRVLPPLEELIAVAQRSHGELVALERELDAAGLAERAAARRMIPEPEIVAGTKSSSAGGGDTGSIISVHVALPLFDRARPERAAAQARSRQVRAEAETFRRMLRAQITAWHASVAERREIADRFRAAMAPGADEIERIARVSYEAGEGSVLELLDAHRTALSARMRLAALDAAVREAEIELEFVTGWEIP
jgi:cobalt-zinc-cadmium efflux system outer membrane protein